MSIRRQLINRATNYLHRDGVMIVNGVPMARKKLYDAQILVRDLAEELSRADRELTKLKNDQQT